MTRPIRVSPYMKVRIFAHRDKVTFVRYSRGNKQIESTFDITFDEIAAVNELISQQLGD